MNDFTDSELQDQPLYPSLLADALMAIVAVLVCLAVVWFSWPWWLPLMRWVML